jgi:glycosyltransferase involved in cell wall biosynthesis
MKILLLTTHLEIGGVGIYTLSLAIYLKKAGIDVTVASSGGELTDDLKEAGIKHINIPVNTSADIGFHTIISVFKLSAFIKQNGIDIVHAQTRVTQVIACMVSRKTHSAFVSTCHGFFKMKLFRRIFPCWGDRTIAISDAVRQHLVCDLKVPKERISIIYNGIDVQRFKPGLSYEDKQLIKKQYSLSTGPVIGTISRLSEVKGHRYLIGAFASVLKSVPDAQLLIVGDGPHRYKNSLISLSENLGISSKVFFLPACRDTTIPLSVIDIFCHPSLQEGLGLSILEAMAMERAVVASDTGGIYTLIKHDVNGILVPPKNEQALTSAIIQILSNSDRAAQMGKLSRQMVLENFTLDIMRDKVIEVYRHIKNT